MLWSQGLCQAYERGWERSEGLPASVKPQMQLGFLYRLLLMRVLFLDQHSEHGHGVVVIVLLPVW